MRWQRSWRFDPRAVAIADSHYSRRKVGSPQFVAPGRNIVLITPEASALWVTSWPYARLVRHAWAGAWTCSLFRNEGADLSSDLIRQAVAVTRWTYGPPPELGFVTFINPKKVRRKRDPGRCFRRAGWTVAGECYHGADELHRARPRRGSWCCAWSPAPCRSQSLRSGISCCSITLPTEEEDPTMASFHVAPTGSDTNDGSEARPVKTITRAKNLMRAAGDEILLHAGTHSGKVVLDKPGTATAMNVLRGGLDGVATLTAPLAAVPVSSQGPTLERTLTVKAGGWRITDLSIVGGLLNLATLIHTVPGGLLDDHAAPGCGETPDPGAHEGLFAWLKARGSKAVPIDNFDYRRLKISKRGVYLSGARHGEFDDCEIFDIDGGTGGGLWAGRGSSFWHMANCHVHDLAASYNPQTNVQHHWMSECVRLATMSSYWIVENSLAERAAGHGRGFNCDVNSNHHVFRRNTARFCNRAMSNQADCWGVQWLENLMEDSREMGFSVGKGTHGILMRCNRSVRAVKRDIFIMESTRGRFEANDFRKVGVNNSSPYFFQPKFGPWGNVWDGRTSVPVATDSMDVSAFAACGPVGAPA